VATLPTTNLTANWDASVMTGNVYASMVGDVPTGSVSDGGSVGAWKSTVNTAHLWVPNDSVTVFQPPTITWEQDTVLFQPSIKFVAGTMRAALASGGGVAGSLATSDFMTNSGKTLAVSFLIDSAALLANSATGYLNSFLVGNAKNEFFGIYLRNNGGTLTLYAYNWDGSADLLSTTLSFDTPYVAIVRHTGGTFYLTVLTVGGSVVVDTSTASGNTTNIASAWRMSDSNAAGTEQFEGRIGQISTYSAGLTGTDFDDLKDYYADKWLANTTTLESGTFIVTGTDITSLEFDGGLQILIDGVDKTAQARQRGVRLHYSLSGAWTADFIVRDTDSTASAYRPDLDESVLITYHGQLIHKGNIVTVRDAPLAKTDSGVATFVLSKMNRVSTDQVIVTDEYAAGQTQKAIVTSIFNEYLAPNFTGIVLDPTMLDGPTITETLTFDAARLQDVWNRITTITGWPIRLTPNDVLESFEPGTKTASYALTAANGLAEYVGTGGVRPVVTWEKTRGTLANRITMRYGEGVRQKTDAFTGDGTTTAFTLTYPLYGYIPYTADGAIGYAVVNVSWGTTEALGGLDSGLAWIYNPDEQTITRTSGAPTNGATFSILYDVQFPQTVTVSDQTSIDAVGLFHRTAPDAPDVFDIDEATALAEGYLRSSESPKIVTIHTRQYPMPFPGDVINLAFADRTIADDDYLISQIEGHDYVSDELAFKLTCVEGTEARRTWTELLQARLGV
jgi:hypothetical protein